MLSSILLAAFLLQQAEDWKSPQIPKRIGRALPEAEGFPPKANAGQVVFLSSLPKDDEWTAPIAILAKERKPKAILNFAWDALDETFVKLRELAPEFVVVFVSPEELDVNRHFDFLERATRLDADPFVDFSYGYLTAATPAELKGFVENILKAQKSGLPKKMLDFGPAEENQFTSFTNDNLAPSFKSARLSHKETS